MRQEKNKISSIFLHIRCKYSACAGNKTSANQCRLKCSLAQICNGFFCAGKWPQLEPVAVMLGRKTMSGFRVKNRRGDGKHGRFCPVCRVLA